MVEILQLRTRVGRVLSNPDRFAIGAVIDLIRDLHDVCSVSRSAAIEMLEEEVLRLRKQVEDLQAANTRSLLRAREAEGLAKGDNQS